MKSTTFLFIFLYPFWISCSCQVIVTGKVIDFTTHKPIPYCNIYFSESKTGSLTDANGYFYLSSTQSGILNISNVAYTEKQYTIGNSIDLGSVFLKEKVIELKPINIKPQKCKTNKYGISKKSFMHPYRYSKCGETAGNKVALFIDNPCKDDETATLKSLFYYIIDPSKTGYLFRIQVYDASGKVLHAPYGPGIPLIPENLIFRKPKTNGWVEFNISEYRIQVPKKGFFVSIEFLEDSPYKKHKSSKLSSEFSFSQYNNDTIEKEIVWPVYPDSTFTVKQSAVKIKKRELKNTIDDGYSIKELHENVIRILYSTHRNNKKRDFFSSGGGAWIYFPAHKSLLIENPCIYTTIEVCK